MTYTDLEQLLDTCSECDAKAGFETGKQNGSSVIRARCSDCCNVGPWLYSKYDSVIQWNVEQRSRLYAGAWHQDENIQGSVVEEVLATLRKGVQE